MRLLDLTLDDPESNLALDEALLLDSERTEDVLRLWESPCHFVVLGRGSKIDVEAQRENCSRDSIPVLRRCSGGAAIVTGPGCLMYSVLLGDSFPIGSVDAIHDLVLGRMCQALSTKEQQVEKQGVSDMAVVSDRKKFSGNALRIRRQDGRQRVLYHGTILYDYPLANVAQYLGQPPRTPEYREDRTHEEFVTNLRLPVHEIRDRIVAGWEAHQMLTSWPKSRVAALAEEKYRLDAWNLRH